MKNAAGHTAGGSLGGAVLSAAACIDGKMPCGLVRTCQRFAISGQRRLASSQEGLSRSGPFRAGLTRTRVPLVPPEARFNEAATERQIKQHGGPDWCPPSLPQKVRQLRNIRRNAPRLVPREHLRRRSPAGLVLEIDLGEAPARVEAAGRPGQLRSGPGANDYTRSKDDAAP
jgi:hypothetical protein